MLETSQNRTGAITSTDGVVIWGERARQGGHVCQMAVLGRATATPVKGTELAGDLFTKILTKRLNTSTLTQDLAPN
jgi:hypothetical protein